jgi:hypothetical protein
MQQQNCYSNCRIDEIYPMKTLLGTDVTSDELAARNWYETILICSRSIITSKLTILCKCCLSLTDKLNCMLGGTAIELVKLLDFTEDQINLDRIPVYPNGFT